MKIASGLLSLLALLSHVACYDKFFLIIFENNGYSGTLATWSWKSLVSESFLLTDYYGVTHPSQPNYVSFLGGSFLECSGDSPCNMNHTNLVDLLEENGISWKGYFEDYRQSDSGGCVLANTINSYSRSHNPFMSFTTITGNATRCKNVVNEYEFQTDVTQNRLPNLSIYVPNNKNNSHDTSLSYSGSYLTDWLQKWYYPYLETTWKDTLLMVTFDEDGREEENHVVAFLKHPCIGPGISSSDVKYNHYSTLRAIEDNWNLGSLGRNDEKAISFLSILPNNCSADNSSNGNPEDTTTSTDSETTKGSEPIEPLPEKELEVLENSSIEPSSESNSQSTIITIPADETNTIHEIDEDNEYSLKDRYTQDLTSRDEEIKNTDTIATTTTTTTTTTAHVESKEIYTQDLSSREEDIKITGTTTTSISSSSTNSTSKDIYTQDLNSQEETIKTTGIMTETTPTTTNMTNSDTVSKEIYTQDLNSKEENSKTTGTSTTPTTSTETMNNENNTLSKDIFTQDLNSKEDNIKTTGTATTTTVTETTNENNNTLSKDIFTQDLNSQEDNIKTTGTSTTTETTTNTENSTLSKDIFTQDLSSREDDLKTTGTTTTTTTITTTTASNNSKNIRSQDIISDNKITGVYTEDMNTKEETKISNGGTTDTMPVTTDKGGNSEYSSNHPPSIESEFQKLNKAFIVLCGMAAGILILVLIYLLYQCSKGEETTVLTSSQPSPYRTFVETNTRRLQLYMSTVPKKNRTRLPPPVLSYPL